MERKKRSKGRGWESCYVKTIYGTFGVEMRAYGQKLVQFCTHTHTRVSFSSIDIYVCGLGDNVIVTLPGFSRQTTQLLNEQGVKFSTFDILSDNEVRQGTMLAVA